MRFPEIITSSKNSKSTLDKLQTSFEVFQMYKRNIIKQKELILAVLALVALIAIIAFFPEIITSSKNSKSTLDKLQTAFEVFQIYKRIIINQKELVLAALLFLH